MLSKFLLLALCCATIISSSALPSTKLLPHRTSVIVAAQSGSASTNSGHDQAPLVGPTTLDLCDQVSPGTIDFDLKQFGLNATNMTMPDPATNATSVVHECRTICKALLKNTIDATLINPRQIIQYPKGECLFQIANLDSCNPVLIPSVANAGFLCAFLYTSSVEYGMDGYVSGDDPTIAAALGALTEASPFLQPPTTMPDDTDDWLTPRATTDTIDVAGMAGHAV